jgi:hypothetical protein
LGDFNVGSGKSGNEVFVMLAAEQGGWGNDCSLIFSANALFIFKNETFVPPRIAGIPSANALFFLKNGTFVPPRIAGIPSANALFFLKNGTFVPPRIAGIPGFLGMY